MLERELRDLMGREYPRGDDDKEVLLLRVTMFPKAVDIYSHNLSWIYDRTDDWFLVEQLVPKLANEIISAKKSYEYFEDFMNSGDLSKTDWSIFYTYADKVCADNPHYHHSKFFETIEKYREQLLGSSYDII